MLKLLVYDFDGVMTNNKVYIDEKGKETVEVNRSDGLAISEIKKLKIKQIILSTEKNPVVKKRAEKLQIPYIQSVDDKKSVLLNYLNSKKIKLDEIGYVGNDINDLEVMKLVGFKFCPKDSHFSIREISDYIMEANGGDGVIRELLDFLNKKKEI